MSNDNEQWLTNGICEKCRKRKYCSKPCTRNKRRASAVLRSATIQAIKRIIPSDVDKILGTYDLRIEELFPMLVTFDGRSTFLPLKPLSCVIFNGTEYDLLISDKNYKLTEQDLLNRYRCMTNNELTWKRIKSTFNAENIKFIE